MKEGERDIETDEVLEPAELVGDERILELLALLTFEVELLPSYQWKYVQYIM